MPAYLHTVIDGNKNFGGYLSVDGEKSISITDDMTYELTPGHHSLIIHSKSDAERASGKLRANLYNNTSSDGALMDSIERASILKSLGDGWEINVMVENNEMLTLNVLSKGNKILNAPAYQVVELSAEEIEDLEKKFEEWRNTPVRSKKLMVWGAILTFCGFVGVTNAIQQNPFEIGGLLVTLGLGALGVILFISGFKKKIRRK